MNIRRNGYIPASRAILVKNSRALNESLSEIEDTVIMVPPHFVQLDGC